MTPVTLVVVEFATGAEVHNAFMWAFMGRSRSTGERSVARQVLLLQVLVVVLLVAGAMTLAAYDARRDTRESATTTAVAVARSVADAPDVVSGVQSADPTAALQPYTEDVRTDTDVDFVVVMALDRTRFTHTTPARIGEKFIGDLGGAPEGEIFTEEYAGTLGPSMRAVVPVLDGQRVVALVSVGITIERIDQQLRRDLVLIAAAAMLVLAVGLLGAWLVNRRLRRQTHGLGEREMTRMFEYYSAVLHAVREGLLLLDEDGRVQLANDEAHRLLALPDDVIGRDVGSLGLPPGLVEAALGRTAETDDIYVAGDHVLVVSSAPANWQGREVGAVVTLRDHTELRAVTGELDVVRGLTESLRSQNHESANRLHTVVSLIEMGRPEQALTFATEELQLAQRLTDEVLGAVGEPAVAALLLGKTSEAAERGIDLAVAGQLPSASGIEARELITVLGNLIDNAMEAVAGAEVRRVVVRLDGTGDRMGISVGDSGSGLGQADADRVLERGWTTKAGKGGHGIGLALVGQVARKHGGRVEIGRSPLGGAEFTVSLAERS